MSQDTTHFGFEQVATGEKAARVAAVFSSVATRYDLMNDAMSLGLHRLWKRFAVALANVRPGDAVLDVASGSGDLAVALAQRVGAGRGVDEHGALKQGGEVWLTDINADMLARGVARACDAGFLLPSVRCDAEKLPFANGRFDLVCVGFGLRNMTDKPAALREMTRVLKPGGRLLVLEFSHVLPWLERPYRLYLNHVLPWLGERLVHDRASYRYLAESIQVHPDQLTLADMLRQAGLVNVEYFNLSAGICALHRGVKP